MPSLRLGVRMQAAKAGVATGPPREVPGEIVVLQPLATLELLDTFTPDESFPVGHVADFTGQAYTEAPGWDGSIFGTFACLDHALIGTGPMGNDHARVGVTSDVVMPSADQYLEAGLVTDGSSLEFLSLGIRYTDVDAAGYVVDVEMDSPTDFHFTLWSPSDFLMEVSVPFTGDTHRVGIAAFGSEIRVFLDDAVVLSAVNDETVQVGNPLIVLDSAPAAGSWLTYVRAFSLAL